MSIIPTLVPSLAAILNFIEFSSQFDCLPNGAPISGVSITWAPNSNNKNDLSPKSRSISPSTCSPPAECELVSFPATESFHDAFSHTGPHSPNSPSPPAEPPLRDRSRSPPSWAITSPRCRVPPTRLPAPDKHGYYSIDDLQLIRLIPNKNPHRIFEFRRYTFPDDRSIKLRTANNIYKPMPILEHIVLSALDGDVFAILETTNALAGLYRFHLKKYKRMKINMEGGTVTFMNPSEVNETPLGSKRPITRNFKILRVHCV